MNDELDGHVIHSLKDFGVQIIGLRCAGFNNVDIEAAKGVLPVVRVPEYSPYAVAEYTVALILTLNRKMHKAYNRTRENNFSIDGLLGFDMYGKIVGIIGTGKIGRTLVPIIKGFGMRVLAYDPYPNEQVAQELGFSYADFDTVIRESNIITLNCPLNKDTFQIINSDAINKMKDNVMIINTSRGKVIDTKALVEGLKSGKIGAAGLDVYEEESQFFFQDKSSELIDDDLLERLLTFHNVVLTSHLGFFTEEAIRNIAETTLNNFKLFFENGKTPNLVELTG